MEALTPRRRVESPILQSITSHKKKGGGPKGKQFHSARGAVGYGKGQGPSNAAKKQDKNDSRTEELESALQQLLLNSSQGSIEEFVERSPKVLKKGKAVPVNVLAPIEGRSWKSQIAHECRNAVVKIIASVISFDFEQPFRRSEDGQAIGSGFFISDSGLIVTNAHVVEEAHKIWVTVPSSGEERYVAEVLGICFDIDLAVLSVKGAPVSKYLEFGDSNAVQYGQEVLILGYPLGMESLKLTEGIISGREESFFQTDAPLNPGNSGGPMINHEGKVIGINVAIAATGQNVGFTIPSFQLLSILETLKTRPKDKRVLHKPLIGADFSNGGEELSEFLDAGKRKGVYVSRCYPGFPLWNAGVREGALLHKFAGYDLDNFGHADVPWSPYAKASLDALMSLLVHDSKPEIEFTLNGKTQTATLNFEDEKEKGYPILPAIREFHPPYEKIGILSPVAYLVVDFEVLGGMVIMDLTTNHINLLHESAASEAVLKNLTPYAADFKERLEASLVISSILLGSTVAKQNSLSTGMLLDEVNGIKVKTLAQLRDAMQKPVKKEKKYYLTFKSKENQLVVLSLQETLKEEIELSEMYMYPLSPLIVATLLNNSEILAAVTQGNKKLRSKIEAMGRTLKEDAAEE